MHVLRDLSDCMVFATTFEHVYSLAYINRRAAPFAKNKTKRSLLDRSTSYFYVKVFSHFLSSSVCTAFLIN